MASLAARHRETYHFNHANPGEVYLADVGEGIFVAVFGLAPERRYPLECTMGFLILSNGVPIGYGGSSTLFLQVNTGINIFDEYRGSEASYLGYSLCAFTTRWSVARDLSLTRISLVLKTRKP